MQVLVEKRYLVLPVSQFASEKRVRLLHQGMLMRAFTMQLDPIAPDFFAYLDVSDLMGETVELEVAPAMAYDVRQSDEIDLPDLYREPRRPLIHFTAKNGWTNDPNGLVFHDGVYHLFFQYNPCAATWGNMHWGHAVSRDLLHWTELDVALKPDQRGTVYSGSAVVDHMNRSKLGRDGDAPIVAFFTSAGETDEQFTQNIAFSRDGGHTLTRFEGNPILPNRAPGNRDPKVVYCDALGCFVMALYLDGERYGLYRSDDLLHWELMQTLTLPNDEECPDLLPFVCEDGETRWVFLGAHDSYVVGAFRDGAFVSLQAQRRLSYGAKFASQSYSNLPNGRIVRICWNTLYIPNNRFSQQMGFPCEATLVRSGDTYLLREQPIEEIRSLYQSERIRNDVIVAKHAPVEQTLGCAPQDIELTLPWQTHGALRILALGIEILCSFENNELHVGDVVSPLSITKEDCHLRILLDRCSAEVFADHGAIVCVGKRFTDDTLPFLRIESSEALTITRLACRALASIWESKL